MAPGKKNARELGAHIIFVDESGFMLIPSVKRTWAPRGSTPVLLHRLRHDRLSAVSAISVSPVRTHLSLYFALYHRNICAEEILAFLRQLLRQIPGHLIVLWDGCPTHRAKVVRAFQESHCRLTIERLPAYAPDLNPDEGVWSQLKGSLANGRPDDLSEIEAHLLYHLGVIGSSQPKLRACIHRSQLPLFSLYVALFMQLAIEPRRTEFRYRHSDGRFMWMESLANPTFDKDGSHDGAVISLRDITEQKLAEEALRTSEEKYRATFETTGTAMFLVDRDALITDANREMEAIFGYSRDEVVGRMRYVELLLPEDVEKVRSRSLELLLGKLQGPIRYEVKARHKSGRTIDAIISINMMPGIEKSLISLIDITERVRVEEELRRSEEIFRVLSDQSLMGIHIIKDGVFKYVNQATADMCGYSVEEIMAWGPDEYAKVLHPDDLPLVLEQARKKQDGESDAITDYEWRLITRTGEVKWIESYSKTIVFEDELADLVTMTDITRRVRADEELRESEEHFRALIENALDLVTVLRADGTVSYVGPSVKRILGYESDELVGRNVFDFIHPEDLGGSTEGLAAAARRPGATEYLELRVRHKDGSWRLHEASSNNLLDNPVVQGIVLNSRDITERKRTTERLEQLNLCFLSLGTDPRENVEKILQAGREILDAYLIKYCCPGRKTQYLCSKSGISSTLLAPEADGCGFLAAPTEEGPVFIRDLTLSSPGSRHPDVVLFGLRSVLAVPVKAERGTFGSLCLFSEAEREFASEERELLMMLARAVAIEEERLRHEESMRDFIDIASHELRHPITIMKGYSLILKEQREKIDEGNRDVILSIIDHGADRLSSLVTGLLDISRIERGRFEVKREMRSLGPIIARAVEEMGARGFNNEFVNHFSGGMRTYNVDEEKFVELMVILLENAVKYSPSGSLIEVGVEENQESVVVSVLDRGIGIQDEDREHVFDRFFQVEEVAHHSTPGMGMGLYIALNIVEAHGGSIWCEPREGGGSSFRFTIPA